MNSECYGDMLRGEERDQSAHSSDHLLQQTVLRLLYWREGGTSFTCELYTLMSKADEKNFDRLSLAFPMEALVYNSWRSSRTEREFFHHYGVIIGIPESIKQ